MIYFTLLFMLLSIALYFLQLRTLKSRDLWRDRYWKAQEEIYRLYGEKFKENSEKISAQVFDKIKEQGKHKKD